MIVLWGALKSWLIWPVRLLFVLVAALTFAGGVIVLSFPDTRDASIDRPAILGMEVENTAESAPRWHEVLRVLPGGAAEQAGIQTGDSVRFDTFLGGVQLWPKGDAVGLEVQQGGERFHAELIARSPQKVTDREQIAARVLQASVALITVGFFILLVLRGWRNRMALQLAAMIVVLPGMPLDILLPAGSSLWLVVLPFLVLVYVGFLVVWLPFCLELTGGPFSRRQMTLVAVAVAIFSLLYAWQEPARLGVVPRFGLNVNMVAALIGIAVQTLGYGIIAANYHRTDAAGRNRIKIVLTAFIVLIVAYTAKNVFGVGTAGGSAGGIALFHGLLLVTLCVLAYGVLRQRLFDLGFAINRTLVYGAAAFTLLVTFGLVEYIAKSMIPHVWPTAGPFISAGIAVLLFLMFHRLHHWFEHHIERLFFGDWHRAEAALKRFVESAEHFEQVDALCHDFVDELRRYTGADEVVLYLRGDQGGYARIAGQMKGAIALYGDDGRGFAMMRTERRPMDLAAADRPLPGELALPMLNQGTLIGFVLMGAKPDGLQFRPDEVENLGEATQQVGLDMQALRARELRSLLASQQEQNASLLRQNERIAAERDRLTALLDRLATKLLN